MSDDLIAGAKWTLENAAGMTLDNEEVKQLCDMADRIEELEAAHANLKAMIADQINSTGDDPEIMAASRAEWAARAKTAEAKLAKAVEFAEIVERVGHGALWDLARATLSELTGE